MTVCHTLAMATTTLAHITLTRVSVLEDFLTSRALRQISWFLNSKKYLTNPDYSTIYKTV